MQIKLILCSLFVNQRSKICSRHKPLGKFFFWKLSAAEARRRFPGSGRIHGSFAGWFRRVAKSLGNLSFSSFLSLERFTHLNESCMELIFFFICKLTRSIDSHGERSSSDFSTTPSRRSLPNLERDLRHCILGICKCYVNCS